MNACVHAFVWEIVSHHLHVLLDADVHAGLHAEMHLRIECLPQVHAIRSSSAREHVRDMCLAAMQGSIYWRKC